MGSPQYRYKAEAGEVIAKIFDSDEPRGEEWKDSPAICKQQIEEAKKKPEQPAIPKNPKKKNGARK